MIHKKICVVCKREFETNRISAVYCGELCACKARSIKALKYAKRADHFPRACAECGGEFIPKSNKNKFCSEDCKRIYTSKKNKTGFAPKACEYCGNEFTPNSSSAKYCSAECRKEGKREALRSAKCKCNKNVDIEKPTKENTEKKSPAQRRWEKMSWKELSTECARLHLTYGQAQVMAMNGTLPEDFGLKSKISRKGDCPQNGKI